MSRKQIIMMLSAIVMIITSVGIISENTFKADSSTKTTNLFTENQNISTWKEVSIEEGKSYTRCSGMKEFDLKDTILNADYVFSGTVVNRKEYKVEWTDDKGEHWGPFPSSVIEVKLSHEYYGKSQVKSDVIKVYYPYSLSTVFEGSFVIKDKGEYIFITRALDDEFIEKRKKTAPNDKFQQENYADVYISHPSYSIMPIENGTVFLYNDYFSWDNEIMNKIRKEKSIISDKMSSSELIDTGWFIALEQKNFDKAFLKLFENANELPNANELQKIKETNGHKD